MFSDIHDTQIDVINYQAIISLEVLGLYHPTQRQIDSMEEILKIKETRSYNQSGKKAN